MFKRTERSASAQALRSVLLPRIKLTAEGKKNHFYNTPQVYFDNVSTRTPGAFTGIGSAQRDCIGHSRLGLKAIISIHFLP